MTEDFWTAIERLEWQGNVRELKNAVDSAVVLARGGPLMATHIPTTSTTSTTTNSNVSQQLQRAIAAWVKDHLADSLHLATVDLYRQFLNVAEPALFDEVLSHTAQNRTAAAKLLGLDRTTLRSKLGN